MPFLTAPGSVVPAIVLTATHLALASVVTVHALLHKRDPRAAVAWIGLAWLSPVIGSLLYVILGINRVRTRARALLATDELAEAKSVAASLSPAGAFSTVAAAGARLTGRPVLGGNKVRILRNGDQAYPEMLAAIDGAKHSIGLSSYIFRADPAGEEFIAALAAAAGRGVQVRVLIDGIGGGYTVSAAYAALKSRDVPVARFLHSVAPWRMPFINLRNHRKLLLVDGQRAFTGGLNIGAENVLAAHPKAPVVDTHFCLEGPIVAQLVGCFVADWSFTAGEVLRGPLWFPDIGEAGDTPARTVTSGPNQDLEKIELLIMEALGCARRCVRIMTPYFLPDDRLTVALSLAALRGVTVEIVLPSRSNHPWIDWANRAHIEPLLVAGCEIYTHPAPFDHSKLLAVDGQWCLIGSANWDTRSFTLNFEVNVEMYDATMALAIDELISAARVTRLTVADLQGRSLPHRLRDSAARLLSPYL